VGRNRPSIVTISGTHHSEASTGSVAVKSVLGITDVNYVQGQQALAVVDSSLALESAKHK
jgi:hypothetical protein